ncbi:MAG TPA: transcriptional regulator [Stellaceae bacterium]|jgi:antitoxin PrlF|nr:transcriptional regulator [Stellaceae bacterium]
MIKRKITGPAQTSEGDDLGHRIEGDHVPLTEANREQIGDPFASFREWWSEADRRAFGDLETGTRTAQLDLFAQKDV